MENKNIKEIAIKIEGKDWEAALEKAFDKANGKAKIDGFRPGKAPKEVFLKKYGKESLFMEAADLCVSDAYGKMLDDNKGLDIVAQPAVDLKSIDETGVSFVFTLTLKPTVKLGKYKGLKVTKDEVKATKEEVETAIKEMLNRYAENVAKDGSIELGDVVIIDFEGFKDGVPFDGGKAENYSLTIGSNTFIPGFEEQLIGLSKGDTKDINLNFPENYHSEELKGQPVVFKITVNDIKTTTIPELDADFFADLGMDGISSKKDLEKQLEDNILARKQSTVENKYVDDLLEEVAKEVEVDIPEVMTNEEINRMIGQYEENLKMQGITLEQFYQFTNSNEAALRTQMTEEAKKRVTFRLVLEQIAKEEKIVIKEEEALEEAAKLAEKYQMAQDEFLKLFGGIEMVKYDLEMRKAIEVLKG